LTAVLACFGALIFLAVMVRAPFSSAQTAESISTFAANCNTPRAIFNLGDTVCAVATDAPLGPPAQRRFEWVTPAGEIFQLGPEITSAPQNSSITIPSSGASAQVGTWLVKTVDVSNNGYAVARFVVQDPNNAAVDLWTPLFPPSQVSAGSSAPFTVFVTNKGPNDAHNVELTVTTATNSTFVSENQTSGPAFTCTNPSAGGTGLSTCTIATLPANTTAVLQFIFQVDAGATAGAEVSSTATVRSDTAEIFAADNTFTASAAITQQTCDITCPPDMTVEKEPGQCGAVVTYGNATGTGADCGTIECSPPSGTVFPIGTTNVICFGSSGGPCAFAVTVTDPQPATITCPANISTTESSPGLGFSVVNYPSPTLNDNCPAPLSACNPPSGSSFPVGTTTVTCETGDGSSSTVTCTFTVTVESLVCLIVCSEDLFVPENPVGSGSASVTYTEPTASGCPTLTIICSPPSGSTFSLGTTPVSCDAHDESNNLIASCSFSVTVTNAVNCELICPANVIATENPSGSGTAVVNYSQPTTTGCPTLTISCSPPSGSTFSLGTTPVTCTGTSATGNTASCSFLVTVNGAAPCTITCPGNISVNNQTGQCGAVVNYPDPTASSNCGGDPPFCSPPSGSFFPAGVTVVTCITGAGTQCSFSVTVLDAQKPVVTTSVSSPLLWSSNHNLINVGLAVTKSDNCDTNPNVQVLVYGDEDDLGEGDDGNFSPDARNIAPGTLRLRAERSGDANGRVYLIVVKVTDAGGNVGFNCSTVVVPKSESQSDINSVNAQAVAARAFCLANNGAPPPGYFVVGDGPVVGPKQ
jgi:hypothetical protein